MLRYPIGECRLSPAPTALDAPFITSTLDASRAGQTTTISQTVTLPANMVKGNYTVLLNLHEPQASLSSRPEYSIQLANSGTWEAATGFNNLNHTVAVAP